MSSLRRARSSSTAALCVGLMGCAQTSPSRENVAPPVPVSDELAVAPAPVADVVSLQSALERAARAVQPSVVSITSARSVERDGFSSLFGGRGQNEVRGVGSGVVVDARGYVLTNNHVVEGATELVVKLDDGRELEANVVGRDPQTDLAVVRIEAAELTAATLADSSTLRVGQWVMAAGSPFGLPRTVTAGIVSAVGRGAMGIADYGDFIQTDAAVNQGNSGGPLIDLEGRVIGINTAIASRNGGSNGIGFAIPINLARKVMEQLIDDGVVRRGWLGIVMGELTPALAQSFGFRGEGILVNDVDPEGPARTAGIRPGDIITSIDGAAVDDIGQVRNVISLQRPQTEVKLGLFRDGIEQTVALKLGELPSSQPQVTPDKPTVRANDLGLRLEPVPPAIAKRYELRAGQGVLISDVAKSSIAAKAGLMPGDVLLRVGSTEVTSAQQAKQALRQGDLKRGIRVRVKRGPWARFAVIRADSTK